MLRTGRIALALTLAAGSLALSACGDEESGTIPPDSANALLAEVDTLQQNVESGDCSLAAGTAERLMDDVNALPKEVGEPTKDDLRDLVTNAENLVSQECEEPDTGASGDTGVVPTTTSTTSSTTTTTTTEPEEESPPEQQPDEGTGVPGNGQGGNNGNSGGTSGGTGG